ncbi:MAG: hypothetical protein ISR84_00060 [Kiritimatiellales bacterium]|nr:hypothetical protein [Kiritimatiellota bacterium]MBL7015930.1 hypothetical protein [Kiritimatiellales bacterium]
MDSARFIRNPGVLIAWLIIPPALALLVDRTAHGYVQRQEIRCAQFQTLERIIPNLVESDRDFIALTTPFQLQTAPGSSAEDANIALLNDAAEQSGFSITAINLNQIPIGKSPKTVRIDMSITGHGLTRAFAEFLREVKARDPFIYESQVVISRAATGYKDNDVAATLSKLYINTPENSP